MSADAGLQLGVRMFAVDFTSPNTTMYARLMLDDVIFPALGDYTVELFCNDVFLDDQPIQLLAPKG